MFINESNKTGNNGLYVGVYFTPETQQSIVDLATEHGITSEHMQQLHTTVMYSTDKVPDETYWRAQIIADSLVDKHIPLNNAKFEIFKFSEADKTSCLVLTYETPLLSSIHEVYKQYFEIEPTYKYNPHITLAVAKWVPKHWRELTNKPKFDYPINLVIGRAKAYEPT